MSKEISKSPEMLQKEARIKQLHQQIKKERTTLKRLQTRLKNTKQEIIDIQRTVSNAVFSRMEKTEALQTEILELLKICKKFKGLDESEEEQVDMLIDEMEEMTKGAEFDPFQANNETRESPEFEEQQRAKMRDIFQEFQVKPAEEEQKNIRKVFINLSTNFHPDKARNDKDRKDYHSLMQQINEAYQSGDIDKLLELEKIYLSDKVVNFTGKAVTVDMLTQEIERLGRDLNFIKNQTKRISSEIKALRKSEMGNMLTDVNRAEKYGMGLGEVTEDMDTAIEPLIDLRDVLHQCVKKGNLDPLKEMVERQMSLSPLDFMEGLEMDDEMFAMMMSESFDDSFDDTPEPVKNPKFPIGTPVQIKKYIPYPYATGLNLKGWQGYVLDIYKIGKEVTYIVQLDSIALKTLPKDLVDTLIDDQEEFSVVEVGLGDIKKTPPRDTSKEAISTYRRILHSQEWDYLSKKDNAMMQDILLKFPEKSDRENWEFWLKENLKFPFKGESRGYYNDASGTKMEVTAIKTWYEESGLLVFVNKNRAAIDHPLDDIRTNGQNKNILALYSEWYGLRF